MRHVSLTCKNHPELRWSCKSIAFTPGKGYNGIRHIFFATGGDECRCPSADLVLAPEEIEAQKTDPTYDKDGRDLC